MADSSAMLSLNLWDLAPGEAISQSLPVRGLLAALAPLCPAPTLDTDEFLAENCFGEDCSAVGSMAEYGLAPGEVRSQSPFRALLGSQPQRCPPPTLDTEEFENNIESQDPWIVEDSQAGSDLRRGECRSQGPASDFADARNQFCPPRLDTRELGNNRVISNSVLFVEDSQAPWDSARGEAREQGSSRHLNDFKSQCFPSLVHAPDNLAKPVSSSAGKRSLPHCPPHKDNGESKKQAKLDSGASFLDELDSIYLPALPTGRSINGEGDRKVSILRAAESSVEQNVGVDKQDDCGLFVLSPQKHALPTPVPPTTSDNAENEFHITSPGRRFASTDVAASRVADARSLKVSNSKSKALTSCEDLADSTRNLSSEGVSSTSRDNKSENRKVLTSPVRNVDKNGVLPATDEVGYRMKGPEVDPQGPGNKASRGAQAKPKVLSSLGIQAKTSRKVAEKDVERDPEAWLCPKAGKMFRPRPKQVSMDRFIS